MLAAIGVARMEDLFADVPAHVRFPDLKLPPPASELDIVREMQALAARNLAVDPSLSFLGAGTYHHFRPATVDYVLSRGEFYTSYTQYQPEVSQGMLQALFEYQSMICRLTGMEVSNASHYDGATALAEAVLLALNVGAGQAQQDRAVAGRPPAIPRGGEDLPARHACGDHRRRRGRRRPISIGSSRCSIRTPPRSSSRIPTSSASAKPVDGLADAVHRAGALLIVVTDPISLGLFRPPGDYGADVVVADGQSLGIPPSFGGPHLGIFAARMAHVRRLSGHLVGETVDADGRRGYVLTLATREQHIRRAKATSNICTNSAVCALGAAVYLATMGKSGLQAGRRALLPQEPLRRRRNRQAQGLRGQPAGAGTAVLQGVRGAAAAARSPRSTHLLRDGTASSAATISAATIRTLQNHMLIAVTEVNTRASIDRLVRALGEVAR